MHKSKQRCPWVRQNLMNTILREFNCRISIYLSEIPQAYFFFVWAEWRRVVSLTLTTVGRLRLFVAFCSRTQQLHSLSAGGAWGRGRWAVGGGCGRGRPFSTRLASIALKRFPPGFSQPFAFVPPDWRLLSFALMGLPLLLLIICTHE